MWLISRSRRPSVGSPSAANVSMKRCHHPPRPWPALATVGFRKTRFEPAIIVHHIALQYWPAAQKFDLIRLKILFEFRRNIRKFPPSENRLNLRRRLAFHSEFHRTRILFLRNLESFPAGDGLDSDLARRVWTTVNFYRVSVFRDGIGFQLFRKSAASSCRRAALFCSGDNFLAASTASCWTFCRETKIELFWFTT